MITDEAVSYTHLDVYKRQLTSADLRRADNIYLVNSVRQWQSAILVDESPNRGLEPGQSSRG